MGSILRYAGVAASIVLIAIGITSVAVGFSGRDRVRDDLAREQIVGTPDMGDIANKKIDTGSKAQEFAKGMRRHTLEATDGKTYSQMPRFAGKSGQPTNDEKAAAVDPKSGKPQDNPARQIWITETALSTALNTAYFAESVSVFAIAIGFGLILIGIGFLVVTVRLLGASRAAAMPARGGLATARA
jgi:hypothetical protein